jgi:hypothetical protein
MEGVQCKGYTRKTPSVAVLDLLFPFVECTRLWPTRNYVGLLYPTMRNMNKFVLSYQTTLFLYLLA